MFAANKMSSAIAKTLAKTLLAITISYGVINTAAAEAIKVNSHSVKYENSNIAVRPPSSSDARISATLIDSQNKLWIGTWQGLIQLDQRTGRAISSISLPNPTVTALLEDKRGFFLGRYNFRLISD